MVEFGLKMRHIRPIGLDIGNSSIKMMQLAVTGDRISVAAADRVRIEASLYEDPEGRRDFIVSAIKEMLSNGKFRGTKVNVCLQSNDLKFTSFRLNSLEEEDLDSVLSREAKKHFGLDADTDTVDYLLAGSVRQGDEVKKELILFAVEKDVINEHTRIVEEAGLRPVSIDITPCALFRCFMRYLRRQEDKEETIVFVDIGSKLTTVVFGRGREINFVKQIPTGAEKFDREVAARAGISIEEASRLRQRLQKEKKADIHKVNINSPEDGKGVEILDASTRQTIIDAINIVSEDLAKEISLCFRYYTVTFRGKQVNRALIGGGGAYESVLLNVLKRQLPVEIEVAQPLRGIDVSEMACKDGELFCEWVIATGLGLKGLNSENLDSVSELYERN